MSLSSLVTGLQQQQGMPPQGGTNLPIGQVPGMAWQNLGSSAGNFLEGIWDTVSDPVGTARGLGGLLLGASQKGWEQLGVEPTGSASVDLRPQAEAAGQALMDRYGGWEETKRTMATDPVGAGADLASVLTGVPGVARGATQLAGKAAQVPSTVAREGLGMTTGAKGPSIREAFQSGMQGGDIAQRFRDAMRGDLPMDTVVQEARDALSTLYAERGQQYRDNKALWSQDPAVLSFNKLEQALRNSLDVKSFKGVSIDPSTTAVRGKIQEAVNAWKSLDPAEYHTVEGFDALKQRLADIAESTDYGSPSWKIANDAAQATRQTIIDQAPGYAKAMKDYADASKALDEITRELSLGRNALPATALRKLQAILRADVSSGFGRRGELANALERGGADMLRPTLAGQAMSNWAPRGLSSVLGTGMGAAGATMNPSMLAALPAFSPRLVGEAVHGAGRMMGPVGQAAGRVPAQLPAQGLGLAHILAQIQPNYGGGR